MIGNAGVQILCEALKNNKCLSVINLSNNDISQVGCEAIRVLLLENDFLRELYLRWNRITSAGGLLIMEGIQAIGNLAVFDISWNAIKPHDNFSKSDTAISEKIAEIIEKLDNLVHLDISNNHLNEEDFVIIQRALANNHTLYGFHNEGNYGVTDEKMFLVPPSEDNYQEATGKHHLQRRIDGVKCLRKKNDSRLEAHVMTSNCWICEGWSENRFEFTMGKSGQMYVNHKTNPLFIHFEHEDWKPCLLSDVKTRYERQLNNVAQR